MLLRTEDIVKKRGDPEIAGIMTGEGEGVGLRANVHLEEVRPDRPPSFLGAERPEPDGDGAEVEVTIRFRTRDAKILPSSDGGNVLLLDWASARPVE